MTPSLDQDQTKKVIERCKVQRKGKEMESKSMSLGEIQQKLILT